MFSSVQKRWALLLFGAAALYFLYFFGLTRTGLLGPDEPRYAAVGRTMAETGDWVTVDGDRGIVEVRRRLLHLDLIEQPCRLARENASE